MTSTTPGSWPPRETPIPYSPTLEDAFLPQTQAILESVRSRLGVAAAP